MKEHVKNFQNWKQSKINEGLYQDDEPNIKMEMINDEYFISVNDLIYVGKYAADMIADEMADDGETWETKKTSDRLYRELGEAFLYNIEDNHKEFTTDGIFNRDKFDNATITPNDDYPHSLEDFFDIEDDDNW